jgi:transcription elongation factor Elf1
MTNCVLCGGSDYQEVYVDNRIRIISCTTCGLVKQQDCAQAVSRLDKSFDTISTYYERRSFVNHREFCFDQEKIDRTIDIQEEI